MISKNAEKYAGGCEHLNSQLNFVCQLLGTLCPRPRCGGYIMDLPPAIVSKMVRGKYSIAWVVRNCVILPKVIPFGTQVVCPYCNDSFCQVQ